MACGKSTLGRALAATVPGLQFIDLDELVEQSEGMSVADIFASKGEEAFREAEMNALHRAARVPNAVVACGGGTPCRTENMDLMLASGTVVWLKASPEATLRRLLQAPAGQRPKVEKFRHDPQLLATEMQTLEEARAPFYSRAHITFNSDRLETVEQVQESVDEFLNIIKK